MTRRHGAKQGQAGPPKVKDQATARMSRSLQKQEQKCLSSAYSIVGTQERLGKARCRSGCPRQCAPHSEVHGWVYPEARSFVDAIVARKVKRGKKKMWNRATYLRVQIAQTKNHGNKGATKVIDDITRHTELTMRPPEAPRASNPFRSYVLMARVLRLLCGDPCQREPSDKPTPLVAFSLFLATEVQ